MEAACCVSQHLTIYSTAVLFVSAIRCRKRRDSFSPFWFYNRLFVFFKTTTGGNLSYIFSLLFFLSVDTSDAILFGTRALFSEIIIPRVSSFLLFVSVSVHARIWMFLNVYAFLQAGSWQHRCHGSSCQSVAHGIGRGGGPRSRFMGAGGHIETWLDWSCPSPPRPFRRLRPLPSAGQGISRCFFFFFPPVFIC